MADSSPSCPTGDRRSSQLSGCVSYNLDLVSAPAFLLALVHFLLPLTFPEALPASLPSPVPRIWAPWKQQLCPHCRATPLPSLNLLCWLSHSKVLNTEGLLHAPSSGIFLYSSILNPCNFGHSLGRNLGAARHVSLHFFGLVPGLCQALACL